MSMARHLVSGVDVWLNNPIRPHEASGTSGMKASLNGGPNCSILAGWGAAGYGGTGAGGDVGRHKPVRPHEASGTSGMKASLNGVPNCSILDGWWAEGYDGTNGWAIGEEREYQDLETQNAADVNDLYNKLESEIISTFYQRDADGI